MSYKINIRPQKTLDDVLNSIVGTPIEIDHNGRITEEKERYINLLLRPYGFRICMDEDTPRLPPVLNIDNRIIIEPIEEDKTLTRNR